MIVTVEEAARELHTTPLTIRLWMSSGKVSLGDVWQKPGSKRATYRIYRSMLDEEKAKRGIH